MIDWSKMKAREILEIARSIPAVAERWKYEKKKSGLETLWRPLVGNPPSAHPVPRGPGVFVLQRYESRLSPRWWAYWGGHMVWTSGDTRQEAMDLGDKLLREAGYVLDDDLACNVEDGVTEWCRGCGRLKREHQTWPNDPPSTPNEFVPEVFR